MEPMPMDFNYTEWEINFDFDFCRFQFQLYTWISIWYMYSSSNRIVDMIDFRFHLVNQFTRAHPIRRIFNFMLKWFR